MQLVRLPEVQRDPPKVEKARVAMLGPLSFTIGDIPTGAAVYRWLVFELERPEMPNIAAWQSRLNDRKGFRTHVASRDFHLSG